MKPSRKGYVIFPLASAETFAFRVPLASIGNRWMKTRRDPLSGPAAQRASALTVAPTLVTWTQIGFQIFGISGYDNLAIICLSM